MGKKKSRLYGVLLILMVITVFISSGIKCGAAVEVAQEAPNFTLNDINGEKVSLSDFKGKIVFLNFWASWCEPCIRELPELQSLYDDKLTDVVILSISVDSNIDTVKSFMSDNAYSFRCLFDANGSSVFGNWGFEYIPTKVFIDTEGIIRFIHVGGLTKPQMLKYINAIPVSSSPAYTPTGTPTGTPTNTPNGEPTETPTGIPTEIPTGTPIGTPTDTPANTPVPTTPEKGFTLSGWVNPDLISSYSEIKAGFTVEICMEEACLKPTKTDTEGFFSFDNLKAGTYNITISKNNYLKRIIKNVVIDTNKEIGSKSEAISIWCGDMLKNGVQDNAINIIDIMEIIAGFNSVKGDPKYVADRDINVDGAINIADVMVVVSHFNTTTESYPVLF